MGERLSVVKIIDISQLDESESFLPNQEVPKKVEKFAFVNPDIHQGHRHENISSHLLQK